MEGLLRLGRRVIPRGVFRAAQPAYHWSLAVTGNLRYGFPTKGMVVVVVTGTNGKTTTSLLIAELLKAAGHQVGLSSTTTFEVAGERWENTTNRTNLGRWQFLALADRMRQAGCDYLVLEASSEGIAQSRLWGVPIDVAVFTNLTPDHLNFHKTMEKYRLTKERIFADLEQSRHLPGVAKVSVVNADDPVAEEFLRHPADLTLTYGLKKKADFRATKVEIEGRRSGFAVTYHDEKEEIELSLPGKFNVSNALAAMAVARSQGVTWEVIKRRLKKPIEVPGRLEDVETGRDFRVVVDYAHSEDALENLYATLRDQRPGRLIAVLGATGDRDREKRPVLGQVAAGSCEVVVVTDEEPYTEDPAAIREAVAGGVRGAGRKEGRTFRVVPDRRAGIATALNEAKAGDIVVVTGMGHQRYMTVGDRKLPWRDQDVIKEELEKLR